ncbi:hypothetical protein SDRG_04107 [Saprolegnia diclina VS20]|uniref:Uncharacterized protein n=1 Tax=Saprolegnia diclina (strain VS20) TaxID=1156394 RepID=T0QUP1_SAPDV|nr:hypothetical protein SDRG_04107 [Saprolegnia diclina VS20]EQC38396.1 hypothetical protein SDRG_04107 [Saprolegnia diclina VS20]|eukprot:XP_008607988.1 hypothetical protein SDRG_04107 [Saprolegnia diclina VS20]
MAQHMAKTYGIYKLQSSCVGFGNSRFVKILAPHLGGTFTTVPSGSDLLTTFKKISVADQDSWPRRRRDRQRQL